MILHTVNIPSLEHPYATFKFSNEDSKEKRSENKFDLLYVNDNSNAIRKQGLRPNVLDTQFKKQRFTLAPRETICEKASTARPFANA